MNKKTLMAGLASLAFTASACDPFDSPKDFSKIAPCGEYGVQFIEDGSKNWDLVGNGMLPESRVSFEIIQNTRKLVRACEAMTRMTHSDLGESVIRGAKVVMSDDSIDKCLESKKCHIYDEVISRSKWATDKGIPSVCLDISNDIKAEYSDNYKSKNSIPLERATNVLDSLCAVNYYKTVNNAWKTN